jgi:hypothetical protein
LTFLLLFLSKPVPPLRERKSKTYGVRYDRPYKKLNANILWCENIALEDNTVARSFFSRKGGTGFDKKKNQKKSRLTPNPRHFDHLLRRQKNSPVGFLRLRLYM